MKTNINPRTSTKSTIFINAAAIITAAFFLIPGSTQAQSKSAGKQPQQAVRLDRAAPGAAVLAPEQIVREATAAPQRRSIAPSPNAIAVGTYAFTSSTGATLEDMSSGTTVLMAADIDDTASAVTPIGFDFWFDGVRQTLFSVNANGLIRLGVVVATTSFDNSADFATTTNAPKIAPYYDDMWVGNNGKIHYKVVGSAPNRKLVLEWQNEQIPRVATANAGAGTFQAWLYESTGKIEFVYGSGIAVNTANGGYTVGLQSGAATNFASVTTSGPTVSYATANNTQTNAITAGTKYTFTPNIPADPGSLSYTAIGLHTMTLNWTDAATNEVGYAVYRSLDGTNYEFIAQTAANATSFVANGLASNTTYFWKVYAASEGGLSVNAASRPGGPKAILSQATTTGTLSGTQAIGPTGTYTSIGAAVAAINTNGLAGNLILELQAAYVSTVETFPLVINSCGSPSNTITIRPETGATGLSITSASTTATLDLNGATTPFGPTNIIIDGRAGGTGPSQLTIANTATAGVAVRYINGASRNTIKFCTIQGVNTSTTGGVVLFSTSGAVADNVTGNNNNTIDTCDVKDGATTPVNGITSIGSASTALLNTGNTITNSNISNFFSAGSATRGILVTTNTNISNTGWTVSNNRLFQAASRTYTTSNTHIGIFVNGGDNYSVTGNVIGFANSAGTGTYTMTGTVATAFSGIVLQPGDGQNSIQGNTVAGISLGTTTGTLQGISVAIGSADVGTISGNTVGSGTGTGSLTATSTTSGAFIVGLNVSGAAAGTVNVANNTIGSLTATGSPATINPNMNVVQILGGLVTFTNNLLGSNSTANSIQTTTAGTSATAQQLIGMLCGTTLPLTISNNTLANITNAGTGTAHVLRGIQIQSPGVSASASSGTGTISLNTVHDLTGSNANTAAGATNGIFFTTGTGGAPYGGLIDQNTVYSIKATNAGAVATIPIGIVLTGSSSTVGVTGGVVSKNKVYDIRNASTGTAAATPPIAAGILVQTATTFAQAANNMVSLGNAQTTNTEFIGIWNNFAAVATIRAYYNSAHIEGVAASGALPSYCFLRGSNAAASAITTPVDIKNNILDNTRTGGTGKHYAIGNVNTTPATGWSATASNNNVLNSAVAGTVGIWGLALDRDFTQWKSSSGGDGASLSGVSVVFVDAPNGDLHVNFGVTPTAIESGGTAIAGVTIDYDMQTRPGPAGSVNGGATAPDIGADEFDGVPLDISAPSISYTPFANTISTSDRTLTATIADATAVDAGANLPRLYFRKSPAVTYVSTQCSGPITGNAQSGTYNCTTDYSMVGGATANDIIEYFVVAQDTLGNLGSNPGGATGANVNSITFSGTPNSYTILATISGTKTVGAGGGFDYPDLTSAVDALNNSVIVGPVTFELQDSMFVNRPGAPDVFPLTINANSGSSMTNTVTFKPKSGQTVSVSGSASTALFNLNGATWVIFDGSNAINGTTKDLTITNTNTSGAVIRLMNAASNNMVKNCVLAGVSTSTSTGIVFFSTVASGAIGNSNNTIQNNDIRDGATAPIYGVYNLGTLAAKNTNNLIKQNRIFNFQTNGIRDDGNSATVTYSGNEIFELTTQTTSLVGFRPSATNIDGFTFTKNYIHDLNTTSTGTVYGIHLFDTSTLNTSEISNNMIALSPTAPLTLRGIYDQTATGEKYNVYANSVFLGGTVTGASSSEAYYWSIASTTNARDNIFVNARTGGTSKHYAYRTNTTLANLISDYNDIFNTGGTGNVFGNNGTADVPDLPTWQMAPTTGTGKDANSISANPQFAGATNLHIAPMSPARNVGVTIASITDDIDGDTRPQDGIYEIGADEVPNSAPTITAVGVNRQQGSAPSNSTIATVNDVDTGASSVTVTVTSPNPSNGVTISNIVNTGGTVTADVTATCNATNAGFTLQASDGSLTSTDFLTVTFVTSDTAPTLTYNNDMVAFNGSTMINPATGPSDNGSVSTIVVQSTGTYTGTISVDNMTGVVSISNAAPTGTHTITIRATDSCGLMTDATFMLTVPNTAPSIAAAAGVMRQQGSPSSNSTIATVNDTETPAGALTVTVNGGASATVGGVTVSNIVNTGGTVTADVVADCLAANAMFTLEASDGSLMSMDTLSVMVTPDADPTLTYNNDSVAYNGSTMINPATGPSDNGSVSTIMVQSQGTYTGTISVDNVTGIVSISNAKPAGMHTITIRATDNCNRTTDAMFTLTVGAASSNADLSDLTLSGPTALVPTFTPANTTYTADVPNSMTTITVTPTAADANATIKVRVNGGTYGMVMSGTASDPLDLNVGANTIEVQVSAQDEMRPGMIHAPATIKTYTVTVTRASAGSSNADLSNLVLSAGSPLTPPFDSATTDYTLSVPFTTTSTDVTPTASDAGATIKVNGNMVNSGDTFGPIALAVGPNVITTVVTASDTTTMKTYTVTVTRGAQVAVAASAGTANATYTTVKGAFDKINDGTHQGIITISILGDTTEAASAALNASGTGSALYTTIAMSPSGGAARTVSGTLAAPLIDLAGADNVTIDGLNTGGNALTLSNASTVATAGTSTIRFINGATNNVVRNCTISGSSSSTSGTTPTANIVFSTSTVAGGNSSNTISGNTIGPAGASLPTREVMSLGTAANPNATNTVTSNNFFNWTNNCMFVSGTGAGNGWEVNTNSLYQTTARTTAMQGISIQGGSGHTIMGNSIGGTAPLAAGTNLATSNTFIGINLAVGTASPTSVQGNVIKNIRSTFAAGFTASSGINLTAGTANIGNVTGNTVGSANVAERFEINGDSIGINISSTTTVNLSNNTVNNFGTTAADPLTGEFYFGIVVGGTAGAHTVVNNTVTNITNSSVPDTGFNTQTIGMIVQATGAQTIRGNKISAIRSTSTTAPTALNNRVWGLIVSGTAAGTVVDRNSISDITSASAGVGARGDNINGVQTQSLANATFTNNMISVEGGGSADRTVFGILDLSAAPTVANYYFNSVNVFGTATGVNNTYAFNRNSTATVTLRDNIFANKRTGGTGFHVAMANTNAAATGWSPTASDWNLLFNIDNTHITQWLGSAMANNRTLAGWQASQGAVTPGSGGDANSLVGNPLFVSDIDLHITCASPARDRGIAFGSVTTDFDGDMRDAAPDIGADELLLTPPAVVGAVSHKVHGGAGPFDIALPLVGPPGVESRGTSGGLNDYQVIFTFASPVTVGSAMVSSGTGMVALVTPGGTTVTVDLTGVANAQYITITLKCVDDGMNIGDVSVPMGVLVGDATANMSVNSSDVNLIKLKSGNMIDGFNFRADVDANGAINVTDVGIAKLQSGTALP